MSGSQYFLKGESMGVFSLEKVGYAFSDFFGTSYAESQKNKYGQAKEKLETNLKDVATRMDYLDDLKQDVKNLKINNDAAKGKLRTVFEDRTCISKENVDNLIKEIENCYQEYQKQLQKVTEQYDYWCAEVEREDQEMRAKLEEEY